MEQPLIAILEKANVHETVKETLVKMGVLTVDVFSNLVDDKKELKKAVMAQCAGLQEDLTETAKLKHAWRLSEAESCSQIKRKED